MSWAMHQHMPQSALNQLPYTIYTSHGKYTHLTANNPVYGYERHGQLGDPTDPLLTGKFITPFINNSLACRQFNFAEACTQQRPSQYIIPF
eukprot:c6183_g1_i1 orf=154-426(-)